MAGHIHNSRLKPVVEIQVGKAQLNGNAPLLLLRQAVGVNAGQRLDQHGLSVVHMASGSDNHMFHASASDTA